jgi:enoyl-CoA hydratase/carnithine racemase
LGLNDPDHLNAFSLSVIFGLEEAVRTAIAEGIRRFIVFGHGKSFSSGADMDDYLASLEAIRSGDGKGFEEFYQSERALISLSRMLRSPEIFSVAAVHSWVVGAGFETALACDFIVADPTTTFWMPETQAGWNAGMGAAHLLTKTVGLGWARRIMLLNERIDAGTADRIGLVTRLSPEGNQVETAFEILSRLEESAPRALQFQKRLLDILPSLSLDDSREIEVITGYWLAHTRDVREAAQAFVEKRRPHFIGS